MPFPPSVPTDPLKAAAYGTVIMTNGGDPTGQIVYAKLVGYNGFVGPFVLTGDIAVPETQTFTLTSNGQFHFEMYGNDQIAPSGNYWRFTHAESQFSKSVPLAAATVTDVVLAAGDGPYPGGPFVPPAIFVVTTGSYANPVWITSLAATKLTGNLDIARFNGGTSADNTHFWRGDGTWAIPAGGGGSAVWGGITGTLSDQTDLQTALNARGLTASPLSQFAATTSLQLKGVISDETGSGDLVFATSPSLVTPLLGTPTSGTLTNCTGLPKAGVVMATARLLGRTTAGTGAAEEISVASGIVLSGSTLSLGDITPNTVNGNVISVGTGMLTLTSGSIYVGALSFLSVSDGVSATIDASGTIITTGNLTDITALPNHTSGTINGIALTSSNGAGAIGLGDNATITVGDECDLQVQNDIILESDGTGTRTLNISAGGTLGDTAFSSWASPSAAIGTVTPPAATLASLTGVSNLVEIRNGSSAQGLKIFRTWTDAANNESLHLNWSGTDMFISTKASGSGTGRALWLGTDGGVDLNFFTSAQPRWIINSNGHLATYTGNSYDIGNGAGNDPRDIYAGRNLSVTGFSTFTGGTADGVQALSGAGAVNLTTGATAVTTTGAGNALTLADGVNGQIKKVAHAVKGTLGTFVLTPTTANGFSTFTSTAAGDTVIMQFFTSGGWCILGSRGGAIA